MKSLKSANIIRDENTVLFPEGAILNETEQVVGTPIVREVYNDILVNFYALLKDRNININNLEDNTQNGYQILNALKKVVNETVDKFHILTKQGVYWYLPVDLLIIPNGTVFFVRASDDLASGSAVSLSNINQSIFTLIVKNDIKSGDDCVLIYDGNETRIYSLNQQSSNQITSSENLPVYGSVIQDIFDGNKIWYFFDGILSSTFPEFYNLKNTLDLYTGEDTQIKSIVKYDGKLFCLSYIPDNFKYIFGYFSEGNPNNYSEVGFNNGTLSLNPNFDLNVVFFIDHIGRFYFSNQLGNSNFDNIFSCYTYNNQNNQMIFVEDFPLSNAFVKNDNISWSEPENSLLVLDVADVKIFNLNGGYSSFEHQGQLVGQMFRYNKKIYIANGNSAFELKKWN